MLRNIKNIKTKMLFIMITEDSYYMICMYSIHFYFPLMFKIYSYPKYEPLYGSIPLYSFLSYEDSNVYFHCIIVFSCF